MSNRFVYRRGLIPMLVVLAAGTAALSAPVANAATKEAQEAGRIDTKDFTVVPYRGTRGTMPSAANVRAARESVLVGVIQGSESEPNNTFGTADALTGTEGMIRGSHFSGPPTPGTDPDFYSFTVAGPAKVYAATMTSSSTATDSVLEVLGTDGTTVIELDDQDGSGNSSSIAGATLPAAGTYFFRVTNFSTTAPISLYDLYFATRLQTTLPTAETEPNNNGTPQVLPASEYVIGAIDPVGDTDTFSFSALAGETIFLSLDLDPERDVTNFNGRIGLGLFGTPTNFLVSGDSGAFDTIDSEALVLTVKTAGTYQIYVDSQTAGQGGPTATYAFSITHISPTTGSCTTYTNATPTALADLALTSSTIVIPDSRIIQSVKVNLNISHANIPDLDIHLRSPAGTAGNDNGLVSDIGAAAQTGPQDVTLDDEAAFPLAFTVLNNLIFRPEAAYRLDWFRGENSLGTWTVDIRDDTAANVGTLNSWSITICEDPALTGNLIDSEDFEANNGGYTAGGTANEWEYGTPATPAQTGVAPFIAPFLNCASGTSCWKTDLDNTYDISSNQVLTSPAVVLGATVGTVTLSWQARYQTESASFDRAYVRVTEVGNPTNTRIVWHAANQTMSEAVGSGASLGNTPESAGWGRYRADISDFATLNVQVSFHVESDTTGNFGGFAVDDVEFRTTGTVPVELLDFSIE
jgi:subtilisin-like proprotein convertase family protein